MKLRIAVSAAIGLASGVYCWFLMTHLHQGAADFRWALHLEQKLLARQNPYDTPLEQYPLTAALFALPLVRLQPEIAAGLFYGFSSALLAFGLTRRSYRGLMIFLAYPYWAGLLTVQWSPLIAASAFFPSLLPATMAKPQIGLPVFLTRASRRGIVACFIVGALSLALIPRWPLLWIAQIRHYEHFVPLLVLPGPLLLLALLRYRDRDAILLLWLPACRSGDFSTPSSCGSFQNRGARFSPPLSSVGARASGAGTTLRTTLPRWEGGAVIFLYLPMLVVVLSRRYRNPDSRHNRD